MTPNLTPSMLIAELRTKVGSDRNALPQYSDKQIVALVNALLDIAEAAIAATEHIEEMRDAFERGAVTSHDGKNGLRSNRNHDVGVALRAALQKLTEATK